MEGIFGPHSIDLFASRLAHLLPRYVSRFLDPQAVAVDAFSVSWASERARIHCDWDSLPKVAQALAEQPAACATVVCPYFPGELWFQFSHPPKHPNLTPPRKAAARPEFARSEI